MSAAAIAERRFLQQQRCRILYRKALKSVLDWAVHRDIFYIEVKPLSRLLARHIDFYVISALES